MPKEICAKNYKGHQLRVYGSNDKLWWQIKVSEDTPLPDTRPLNFTTPKIFLTKEKALDDAKKFVDDFILTNRSVEAPFNL